MPSNVLDETRAVIDTRISELDGERSRLVKAREALDGDTPRRGPGRPRKDGGSAPKRKPGKRKKGGKATRADDCVALVEKQPGISASEIAKALKIKPNYLYRVLAELEKEKKLTKKGRQYFPKK